MESVKSRGDAAVKEFTSRFDKVDLATVCVPIEVHTLLRVKLPGKPRSFGCTTLHHLFDKRITVASNLLSQGQQTALGQVQAFWTELGAGREAHCGFSVACERVNLVRCRPWPTPNLMRKHALHSTLHLTTSEPSTWHSRLQTWRWRQCQEWSAGE